MNNVQKNLILKLIKDTESKIEYFKNKIAAAVVRDEQLALELKELKALLVKEGD